MGRNLGRRVKTKTYEYVKSPKMNIRFRSEYMTTVLLLQSIIRQALHALCWCNTNFTGSVVVPNLYNRLPINRREDLKHVQIDAFRPAKFVYTMRRTLYCTHNLLWHLPGSIKNNVEAFYKTVLITLKVVVSSSLNTGSIPYLRPSPEPLQNPSRHQHLSPQTISTALTYCSVQRH